MDGLNKRSVLNRVLTWVEMDWNWSTIETAVASLISALAGKADSSALAGKADSSALAGKANTSHSHVRADITNLPKKLVLVISENPSTGAIVVATLQNDWTTAFVVTQPSPGTYQILAVSGNPFVSGKTVLPDRKKFYMPTPDDFEYSVDFAQINVSAFNMFTRFEDNGLGDIIHAKNMSVAVEVTVYP